MDRSFAKPTEKSTQPEILVWLPLPGTANWRGEGILQTVENVLANLPRGQDTPRFRLVVSPAHAMLVTDSVREHPNVVIHGLKYLTPSVRVRSFERFDVERLLSRPKPLDVLKRFVSKIGEKIPFRGQLGLFRYGVVLTLYVTLQRLGIIFRDRTFWFPAPIVPLINWMRGRRICSFWDPFIFEYSAYRPAGHALLPGFYRNFARADRILTQSNYNKNYLASALDIPIDRISVVPNGAPDYSRYRVFVDRTSRDWPYIIVKRFGNDRYRGNVSGVIGKYIADSLARATLLRLLQKLVDVPHARAIFVSTQYRPHKGFHEFFEMARAMVQDDEDEYSYQFVFTATLPEELCSMYPELREQCHELSRLSNRDHALVYQMCDLVVHPSHVEGGSAPYPLFEAASLGVPCLVNHGRHTYELLQEYPWLSSALLDMSKPGPAAARVRRVLGDDRLRQEVVGAVKKAWRGWDIAAAEYLDELVRLDT